jgi:energy-coupling factor transporter ATP-binding protein EcfA2
MRINKVQLCWFRGAAQSTSLVLGCKSVVVYGPNGSGKSTFPDAIEYILRGGWIVHLSHEYSGKKQEKGLINSHAKNNISEIRLDFKGDNYILVQIKHDGSSSFTFHPDGLKQAMRNWEAEKIILRQDEISQFINYTKGQKYSALLPLLGLSKIEQASKNLHDLQEALQQESRLTEKRVELRSMTDSISKYLHSINELEAKNKLIDIAKNYLPTSPDNLPDLLEILTKELDRRINQVEPEITRHTFLKQVSDCNLDQIFERILASQKAAQKQVDDLIRYKIEALEKTHIFVNNIGHEVEELECPVCGSGVTKTHLEEHILCELKLLADAKRSNDLHKKDKNNLSIALYKVIEISSQKEVCSWLDLLERKECKEALKQLSTLDSDKIREEITQEDIKIMQNTIPVIVKHINDALKITPPQVDLLIKHKELIEAIRLIPRVDKLKKEIEAVDKINEVLYASERAVKEKLTKDTKGTINSISKGIMEMWPVLHPGESIEDIHLTLPTTDKGIDICLKFHGIDQPSPRLTLSEGHRNSLGLCIFLTLARTANTKDEPIILDDIITSFDREHRGFVADLLKKFFSDRQVILFTHDREWFSDLRYHLPQNEWDFMCLKSWISPDVGLQISGPFNKTLSDATQLIKVNPEVAANKVRAIMDTDLSIIAEKVNISMPYARGDKNDHRTCVDFLNRIISEANKFKKRTSENGKSIWVTYTVPVLVWKDAVSLLIPWANRGSHGGVVTDKEVEKLAQACQIALDQFKCNACNEYVWFAEQTKDNRLQCRCGDLQWRYSS